MSPSNTQSGRRSGHVLDATNGKYILTIVPTYRQDQLDALGDATRRAIVGRLLDGPMPVGKLARGFPMSRPAISQHLRVLKEAKLVVDRAEGTRRYYELDPRGFDSLRDYLDRFWTHALDAFRKRVEDPTTRRS
jgi:DNA-binding transcriptional ArsR family regulator